MPQSGPPDTRAQPQQSAASTADSADAAPGQAQTRAEARAQAAGRKSSTALPVGLTRPPAAGELAYESTITAPTEWVPYVYTTAEIQIQAARRGLSVAALVCGVLGVLAGIFVVWGVPLSLAAVVLALSARFVQHRTGVLWILALVSGLAGILMGVLWLVVILQLLPAYYG